MKILIQMQNWVDFDVLNGVQKCTELCMNVEMWNYEK